MATINIDVQVENIDEVLATYNRLRLYRCTDPAGDFTVDGVIDTETLVTGTIDYTLQDTAGSAAYVYRYDFYNATTLVASSLSDAFFPTGRTVADIIMAAARRAHGFTGACTAAGTVSLLYDAYLAENGLDEDYLDGCWIFRPDAALSSDWVRRTVRNPFDVSASSLEVVVPWTNLPASGERYAVFPLLSPLPGRSSYSWLEALADALAEIKTPERIDLGLGTSTGKDRFFLTAHAGYVEENLIGKVWLRTVNPDDATLYDEMDASKLQRFWEYHEDGRGNAHIYLNPPPATDEHVIVDVKTKYDRVYAADDITLAPFDLAVWATLVKVYEHMNALTNGGFAGQLQRANESMYTEYGNTRALTAVRQ